MAVYQPELFTIEDVQAFFENAKGTCFRIYAGTNPKTNDYARGECLDGDKHVAADRLSECLIALKQNTDNINPYTIHVFNLVKGKEVDKTAIIFQLNKREQYRPYPAVSGTDPALLQLMKQSVENQNLMLSKLAAMEEEEEDEPEKIGVIGQILQREDVQNLLINGLAALAGNFIGNQKPPTYGGGIAGTVDQESIALLQSLFNKGVNNQVLAKLNEMGEMKLKSLLLML